MSFTIKTTEGVSAVEKFLETNSYLSGGNTPGVQDKNLLDEIEAEKFTPCFNNANLFGWWWTLAPFQAPARALWGADPKAEHAKKSEKTEKVEAPAKKEEELDDLFGDDDPEAEAKAKEQAAKRKEEAEKKKKVKAPVINKSEVVFDVKGYETTDDFDGWAKRILAIQKEGLVWKDSYKIVPVGFGMNKLEMGMIIVDDLISTDDLFEDIGSWEGIQSVDVVKFSKA
jgi:elongation factor 1-beta